MGYKSDNIAFNNAMDSLSHYGVLGMKWGVRNEDTLRKYEGPQGRSAEGVQKGIPGMSKIMPPDWTEKFREAATITSKKVEPHDVSEEELQSVNPNHLDEDHQINCTLCALATDLRAMGYPVSAGGLNQADLASSYNNDDDLNRYHGQSMEDFFVGASGYTIDDDIDPEELEEELKKLGPNRHGILTLYAVYSFEAWVPGYDYIQSIPGAVGHAVAYRTDADGNVTILDGQNGLMAKSVSEYMYKLADANIATLHKQASSEDVKITLSTKNKVGSGTRFVDTTDAMPNWESIIKNDGIDLNPDNSKVPDKQDYEDLVRKGEELRIRGQVDKTFKRK